MRPARKAIHPNSCVEGRELVTPLAPGNSQPQAPCLGEVDTTALNNQHPVAAAESAVCDVTSGLTRWESLRLCTVYV